MKKILSQIEPWIGREEEQALVDYLRSGGWLTEYKKTQQFEEMIAEFVGSKYASVVNNGTVSLFIAVMALGIGEGDEVIVPDFTMIASANAVLLAKATPVLVDIEPKTLCLDLRKAEKAITGRTKAMMYVSLNGRSENMDEVVAFCRKHQISLIEDAAQALGCQWKDRHLGTFGQIGSFSFSAPKIITTGQGGALVTDDKILIDKIRKIKDFGRERGGIDKYETLGYNFKFTDLQAVVGIEQMKKLKSRLKRKKEMFAIYQNELKNIPQVRLIETNLQNTAPWFIDVLVEGREKLIVHLSQNGIGTRPFYPPIHSQAPYHSWKKDQQTHFPVSEEVAKNGLWLPSSSFLSNADIRRVCREIEKFYNA